MVFGRLHPGRSLDTLLPLGEPALEYSEGLSYSDAKASIKEQIGPVRQVLLATGKPVPDSCEVLVIAGPEKDFLPVELESIGNYLDSGGRALFLLEPFKAGNLDSLLASYGIRLDNDLVIDLLNATVISPFIFMISEYETHEITRFFDVGTMFATVRSVRADSTLPRGVTADEFIKTSEMSCAETNTELLRINPEAVMQKAQHQGEQVPLAVASKISFEDSTDAVNSTAGAGEARVVVIGDRDFITNELLPQLGNNDLLLNTLRWLQGQTDQITIAPRETENTPLVLERGQLNTLRLVCLLGMPVSIILAGLLVWVRRRSLR
ncbi:MAG: Gldg family protein [Gemmatimonadota bacterium]|nr:Gldg family protein [Gemmatimonadota bacterium]